MTDISSEERTKIVEALEAGRVEYDPRVTRAIQNMDIHNPDFTITNADVQFWGPFKRDDHPGNKGGINIDWESKSGGCGRVEIHMTNEGKLKIYTQDMSKAFIMDLISFVLDQCEEKD